MVGTFELEGLTFPSAGPTPTQDELRAAAELVKSRKPQQQPDLSNAIAAAGTSENKLEDAPTTGHLVLPGVNPFGKKDIEGNDALSIISKLALQYGTLSTDSPKARQEMYKKHLPGAEVIEDRWGNPMIEYKGKRYYTARPGEIDAMDVGRVTAGIAGSLPLLAFAPATVPGLLAAGAVTAAGQSVAEDLVAKASGGESLPWINVEKALWSGAFGAAFPAILKGAPAIAGRLNELIKRGQPLTDDALRAAGLTDVQISTITPEIRDQVSKIAHRTFNDPKAVGATYRTGLADDAGGVPLTRGEISGEADQIAREQTLAARSDVPGRARGSQIIMGNRAEQDVALNAAQERLTTQVGGRPGQPPMDAETASAAIKDRFKTAFDLTGEATDRAYTHARDPLAVQAAGGKMAVPAPHASQIGQTTRAALDADPVGRLVLGDSAADLTPQAKGALEVIDKFGQRATGPRAGTQLQFAINEPPITKYPDITWEAAENLRQQLRGRLDKAVAAAKSGSGTQQDVAAMQQVLESFDDHFGKLNPLYKPARGAHEEMMKTFVSGAGQEQDAATRQVLKVLDSPEGGQAVTNVILGGHVNNNTAGQMIDHLKNKVFPDQPEVQNILKEQFLRRLTVDKDGKALTPARVVSAIEDAFGERQGSLYAKLFDKDELARLRRFQELQKVISNSRDKINPPNSGLINQAVMNARSAANLGTIAGTAIGTGAGALLGPWGAGAGGAIGGAVGRVAGSAVDAALPAYRAAQAVRPPPGYAQGGAASRVPGLMAAPAAMEARDQAMPPRGPSTVGPGGQVTPGPADRLMDFLRLGGP